MLNTPVLFVIFNRPDTTKKVFDCIREAQPSKLFIAADAPRDGHPTDHERCEVTRAVVEIIDWPCEVHTLFSEKNLGCGKAVSLAINWFFSQNDEGIILEDDCLPHPDFFGFASAMLHRYRNDQRIISINGSNLGYKIPNGNSYTYSRFMNMWGWATWKDRAEKIDYQMGAWKAIKFKQWWVYSKARQHMFDIDLIWYRLWLTKFNKVTDDPGFTWDWQWVFYQLKNQKMTVVPSSNLISNIGFNADATHTFESTNPAANIPLEPILQPFIHPVEITPDFIYEEQYVKWIWCYHKRLPTVFYIKQFLARLLGRS